MRDVSRYRGYLHNHVSAFSDQFSRRTVTPFGQNTALLQNPDSDFEGFDGEHRPPSAGGVRSEADKEIALLEHRLSGQVKGGTMVSAIN